MPSLTDAYQYVIDACNWPYLGYNDGSLRTTIDITVTYRTYCDCSSLMSKALTVGGYFHNNPWFTTQDEVSRLLSIGWEEKPLSGPWLPGDILWIRGNGNHHTEMVYTGGNGTGVTMGAHGTNNGKRPFEQQVSITSGPGGPWYKLFRDPTQSVTEYKWYQSNTYLPDFGDKMNSNAHMVFQYFSRLGFTPAAIAGILGNFQWESRINPGMWQNLDSSDPDNGYGLMQSTPSTKYRVDYAGPHNINLNDPDENGDGQCAYVNDGPSLGQWISNHGYSYSWADFSQLTDYEEATRAFMYQYERPGDPHLTERLEFAEHWYNLFKDGYWGGPDDGQPSGNSKTLRNLITDLQRRLVIPGRH